MDVDTGAESCQRILIVEDEYLLASDLQSALVAEGYAVVGPFGRLSAELDEAVSSLPHAAILDLNLQGEMAYGVVEKLRALSVPVILTTGYGRRALPEDLRAYIFVEKPYKVAQINRRLKEALDATSA